jgi:TPR repeat protein
MLLYLLAFNSTYVYAEKSANQLSLNALNKRALSGDANAQYWMGETYLEGRLKQTPDTLKAEIWFKLSAENGNAAAQYQIAHMYYWGKGVKQNYPEAIKWYKICAFDSLSKSDDNLKAKITYAEIIGKGLHGEQKDINGAIKLLSENRHYIFISYKDEYKWNAKKAQLLGELYFNLHSELDTTDVRDWMNAYQESMGHFGAAVSCWKKWNFTYASNKYEKDWSCHRIGVSYFGYANALYLYNQFSEIPHYKDMMAIYQEAVEYGCEEASQIAIEIGNGNGVNLNLLSKMVGEDYIRMAWLIAKLSYKYQQFDKSFLYYKAIADDTSNVDDNIRLDAYSHLEKMYRFGYGVEIDQKKEEDYHNLLIKLEKH